MTSVTHPLLHETARARNIPVVALRLLQGAASVALLCAAVACASAGLWPLHGFVF